MQSCYCAIIEVIRVGIQGFCKINIVPPAASCFASTYTSLKQVLRVTHVLLLLVGWFATESCCMGPASSRAVVPAGVRALMRLRVNYNDVHE
jgi:hypothetical protein